MLGGTSDIGLAVARRFAREKFQVVLAGRSLPTLDREAKDISIRFDVNAYAIQFDALEKGSAQALLAALTETPNVVLCAIGLMRDSDVDSWDEVEEALIMRTNLEAPSLALGLLAGELCKAGSGVIIGISSIAGVRGRAKNLYYTAAKAGFIAFLSGLRNRCHGTGVRIVTVLPGFVRTKMLGNLQTPKFLTATPEDVAEAVFSACQSGRELVYVKGVWRPISWALRALPESVFKRLKV